MVRVRLAGIPVQMNSRFPDTARLCRRYETQEEPKLVLSVSQEEIEAERSMQADIFTDGYLELVCMYRKLALEVLKQDVFLLHAAVIEVDGEGYAFLAPSGTGKTTQTRLCWSILESGQGSSMATSRWFAWNETETAGSFLPMAHPGAEKKD